MSFHQTLIQGNLGKDPELKTLSSGNDVANFSVAVTEKWISDGEKQEHTEWYNCKVFGKQAEVCEKYLHKGDAVLLAGRMRTRTYDKDGETKYVVELIVDRVSLLDNRGREDNNDKSARGGKDEPRRDSRTATTGRGEGRERPKYREAERPARSNARSAQREEPRRETRERGGDDNGEDFDDDIPF